MPFDFLRRKKGPATPDAGDDSARTGSPGPGPADATGSARPTAPGTAAPSGGPAAGSARGPGTAAGAGPGAGAGTAGSTLPAAGSRSTGSAAALGGPPAASTSATAATGGGIRFDALTEDWRLVGTMNVDGRLSDVLNRRETVTISDVQWAPIDGSEDMVPAPGLRSIDPYDLIAVLAGPDTLPEYTEAERIARRVRKEPYQVVLEAPPFRILGTVHVFPGTDPRQMLEQVPEMFIPLTGAIAYVHDQPVAGPGIEVVLVNRLYVRGVDETGR